MEPDNNNNSSSSELSITLVSTISELDYSDDDLFYDDNEQEPVQNNTGGFMTKLKNVFSKPKSETEPESENIVAFGLRDGFEDDGGDDPVVDDVSEEDEDPMKDWTVSEEQISGRPISEQSVSEIKISKKDKFPEKNDDPPRPNNQTVSSALQKWPSKGKSGEVDSLAMGFQPSQARQQMNRNLIEKIVPIDPESHSELTGSKFTEEEHAESHDNSDLESQNSAKPGFFKKLKAAFTKPKNSNKNGHSDEEEEIRYKNQWDNLSSAGAVESTNSTNANHTPSHTTITSQFGTDSNISNPYEKFEEVQTSTSKKKDLFKKLRLSTLAKPKNIHKFKPKSEKEKRLEEKQAKLKRREAEKRNKQEELGRMAAEKLFHEKVVPKAMLDMEELEKKVLDPFRSEIHLEHFKVKRKSTSSIMLGGLSTLGSVSSLSENVAADHKPSYVWSASSAQCEKNGRNFDHTLESLE